MNRDYAILLLILVSAMAWTVYSGRLTIIAALTGGVLGFILFEGTGFTGVAMMGIFFVLGSAATTWKRRFKEAHGLAEENKGRRTAVQVIANAGVAGSLALLTRNDPLNMQLYHVMIAGSFAAATADTLSSELGNVYGKKYYNILTFKRDHRGLNGVVSLEGSVAGLVGSTIIAVVYSSGLGWNVHHIVVIIISGTLGNLADSILGGTLERRKLLNNNAVNFLNTLVSAFAALLLHRTI